jgi:hypothetical protein
MGVFEIISIVLCVAWVASTMYLLNKYHHPNKHHKEEVLSMSSDRNVQPEVAVKLIHAVNGRILEVSTKKPHPQAIGHYDWEIEMFIVEEGQLLSQAIAAVMLMKGLEA